MTQHNIQITPAAIEYIKYMLQKDPAKIGFRISVKKTGCSGYSYVPALIDKINPNDQLITVDGLSLYVDTGWVDLLSNVRIDFLEETKTGIKQKKLVFTNSQESGRCGCGESFNL